MDESGVIVAAGEVPDGRRSQRRAARGVAQPGDCPCGLLAGPTRTGAGSYLVRAPARTWFDLYAERFGTVEINNTFYRLPPVSTVEKWAEQPPDPCTP